MKLNIIDAMQQLVAKGYSPSTKLVRTFGGPFVLVSPDGRIVWEKDFLKELENEIRL